MNEIEKLRVLAQDADFLKIIGHFANGERARRDVDLVRLKRNLRTKYGIKLDDAKLMLLFEKLQDQGFGRVVVGRNGNPNRFHWDINYIKTAKLALHSIEKESGTKVKAKIEPIETVHAVRVKVGKVEIEIPGDDPELVKKIVEALNK